MKPSVSLGLGCFLLLGACAGTPAAVTSTPGTVRDEGYLTPDDLSRLAQTIPPPPAVGSTVDLADRAASQAFAPLQGGDRWLLATAHAEIRPPIALQHFDCALSVRLAGQATPALDRMMARLFHDADHVAEAVKARALRPRPVADEPDRQACQRVTEAGRASPSYPSGTSAVATAYAEGFAALAPDRDAAVRHIGHEIGVSRLICAMHYPSDVAAGEAAGRAVFQAASTTPAFAADLEAARTELRTVRATGLTNAGCAAEARTLALPLP